MDDKEIDYCKNDVEVLSNYEVMSHIIKQLHDIVNLNDLMIEEIDKLKLKNKILFIIIALLVILKIIGG